MNKIIDAIKWVMRNFFLITIAIFAVFYLIWFRLAPFVLLDDPTFAFIAGCVLLAIYGVLAMFIVRARNRALKVLLAVLNVLVLCINALYLVIHMPSLETTAVCNG